MITIWNKCITSTKIVVILAIVLMSTILIASVINSNEDSSPSLIDKEHTYVDSSKVWIPTKEDIAYQDSMFSIVEQTSMDVDTIKEAIYYIS